MLNWLRVHWRRVCNYCSLPILALPARYEFAKCWHHCAQEQAAGTKFTQAHKLCYRYLTFASHSHPSPSASPRATIMSEKGKRGKKNSRRAICIFIKARYQCRYVILYRAYLSPEYFPVTLAPRYYSIYPTSTALSTHLRRKRCDKKSRYCCHSSSLSRILPPLPPSPLLVDKKAHGQAQYGRKERPAPVRAQSQGPFCIQGHICFGAFQLPHLAQQPERNVGGKNIVP